MKNLFVAVIFLCVACCLKAASPISRNLRFTHVTDERGLSQNNVKAIAKDRDGFLWLGTKNGLNRFDGTSIVRKTCRDGAVEGHDISALCAGRDGTLWVGTERGLFRYQPWNDSFSFIGTRTKEGVEITRWVLNITEDGNGNVWIVVPAQGVFRLYESELSFYPVIPEKQLTRTPISHLYVRGNGEVWLATWGSGIYRYDSSEDTFVPCTVDQGGASLSGLRIVMMTDYGNSLALGIHEGRLLLYDPEKRELSDLYCEGLSTTMVRTLASWEGALWVGTYAGVFVWKDGEAMRWEKRPSDFRSLSDDVIYAMLPDENGIWIGTLSGGVDYASYVEQDFAKYTLEGLTAPLRVRDMVADAAGNMWVATENAGLCQWNMKSGRFESKLLGPDIPMVLSLACRGDLLYCGTFMHSLYTVNTVTGTVRHDTFAGLGVKEESIYALHVDRNGNKWLGTDHGLYRAGADDMHFMKVGMTGDVWIFDIHEALDGTLWLGTMGCGLWAFHPGNATCRKYHHEEDDPSTLSGNSVNSVMQDSKGRLWVSTDGYGLCRLNEGKDTFTVYSLKDGLPDNVVYDVLEDKTGCLWVGTNHGLVRLEPDNGNMRVYTEENGLPENRFNYRASLGTDGHLCFGTVDGIIGFVPDGKVKSQSSYPLFLTRLAVNNKECDVLRCKNGKMLSPAYADDIVLNHDEANISFGVALLDYRSPATDRYYYRMEPLDKDWVMAVDHKNIVYSHLAPGSYELHVKAVSGNSGDASLRTVRIVVLPPWWRTWWAYTLYLLVGIGIVWGAVMEYRHRQERRMRIRQRFFELEKQKELYEAKMQMWTNREQLLADAEESTTDVVVSPASVVPSEAKLVAPVPKKEVSEADKEWADRISRIVNDNLMDESFNVEAMAEILCMSRSTLLRRFKQTFDCSPVELIRTLRLNKSAELIGEGRYRISDIGYMVGFSSASYFSKNFQKQFGVSPKDYAKRCRDMKMKIEVAGHFHVQDPSTE